MCKDESSRKMYMIKPVSANKVSEMATAFPVLQKKMEKVTWMKTFTKLFVDYEQSVEDEDLKEFRKGSYFCEGDSCSLQSIMLW